MSADSSDRDTGSQGDYVTRDVGTLITDTEKAGRVSLGKSRWQKVPGREDMEYKNLRTGNLGKGKGETVMGEEQSG